MSIFEKIEKQYNLKIRGVPVRLNGGFMHKMYKLETEQGTYVLKLLNPFVMQRDTAMKNYAKAEQLESLLEQRNVPILPALSFEGRKMQEIDGEFFYLFDYYSGKILKKEEITEYHCTEMGKVLAQIHQIEPNHTDEIFQEKNINWNFYLTEMKKVDNQLYKLIKEHYSLILESQDNGNRAIRNLSNISTICHNDMDSKNVLWNGKDFRIIDLECLSYNNPQMELFELALCWSGYENCQIDFKLFQAFIQGYATAGGKMPTDWEILYDCNNGRLEWLEYNIKRVLGIDCGEDEKEIGIEQVKETIQHIEYYAKVKKQILESCGEKIL